MLDRDDRGAMNDSIIVNGKKISSPIRQEIVSVRGIVPGEYTVNVHYYVKYFANSPAVPVPVAVKVEKLNPGVEIIYADTTMLESVGQEKTAVRFKVAEDGGVTDVYHGGKSLIQFTRGVRRNSGK